jgi:membrane fusion protein (multidrug efflux system)
MSQGQSVTGIWRRIPYAAWVGVALLIVSLTGVGLGLSTHASNGSPSPPPGKAEMQKAVALGHVDVEQGLTPLHPLQPGRVVDVPVTEGQEVVEGTPLVYLDDSLALIQIREAEAALAEAEVRLEQAQSLEKQLQVKIKAQQAAVEAKKRERDAAREKRDQADRLRRNQLGSEEDYRFAEQTVLALDKGVEAEQAQLDLLKTTASEITPLEAKRAQQDIDAKQAQLDKALLALRHCTVWAPSNGTVLRVQVSAGQPVSTETQQPAILFAPEGPRIIRAEVEQEFAARIAVGQKTVIQDDSTGIGSWTGKVRRLSDWFAHRRSILLEPLQFNDVRTLEAIIDLDPDQKPLRIGQRVRVHFQND